MDPLSLPLDYAVIERILPHRYPFLLVDRVTELEPDKRIVGIKNVSSNERYLSHQPGERPALPPTILTECIAQVGAILILSKPRTADGFLFSEASNGFVSEGRFTREMSSRSKPGSKAFAAASVSCTGSRA